MKGDFSRWSYLKERQYSEILMQQGRVQVDADWNEMQEINQHRIETETEDVIGKCGTPADDPGFEITTDGTTIYIGKGRYYVDGILCENFPKEGKIAYDQQTDLPKPQSVLDLLNSRKSNGGLVFLRAWKRHITALDDPHIQEKALGDPDTCTRVKIIWQVSILPLSNAELDKIIGDCNAIIPSWSLLTACRPGLMNAQIMDSKEVAPCRLPPSSGYKGLENQLYRVEIHRGGSLKQATFKWSRDNGSVVTSITGINGSEITVKDLGRDEVLGFNLGNWVEISDDYSELHGIPGYLAKIDKIDRATNKITVQSIVWNFDSNLHPKLRRWDQTDNMDNSSSPGTPDGVKITDDWQLLENGIYVMFSDSNSNDSPNSQQGKSIKPAIADAPIETISPTVTVVTNTPTSNSGIPASTVEPGGFSKLPKIFSPGEYWLIPARAATHEIEWPPFEMTKAIPKAEPEPQPPLGIEYHYCRLAIITKPGLKLKVRDCRNKFPSLTKIPPKDSGQKDPGIHILSVEIGDRKETVNDKIYTIYKNLRNDDRVSLENLKMGLKIICDKTIDPQIINPYYDRFDLPNPKCLIAVYLPTPQQVFCEYILKSELSVKGDTIFWYPHKDLITSIEHGLLSDISVLAHLTLKGNYIWSDSDPNLFLDGEVFGNGDVFEIPNVGQGIDIQLPSGNGIKGGDFEMWFIVNNLFA
ncbi:MAG: DUF6519 domain-containing protein [Methanotrichaceae archaeon]